MKVEITLGELTAKFLRESAARYDVPTDALFRIMYTPKLLSSIKAVILKRIDKDGNRNDIPYDWAVEDEQLEIRLLDDDEIDYTSEVPEQDYGNIIMINLSSNIFRKEADAICKAITKVAVGDHHSYIVKEFNANADINECICIKLPECLWESFLSYIETNFQKPTPAFVWLADTIATLRSEEGVKVAIALNFGHKEIIFDGYQFIGGKAEEVLLELKRLASFRLGLQNFLSKEFLSKGVFRLVLELKYGMSLVLHTTMEYFDLSDPSEERSFSQAIITSDGSLQQEETENG